jgi:hypothetical protein
MNRIVIVLIAFFVCSCNSKKKVPDVSTIKVQLSTERFEKDFFALDTTKLDTELQGLFTKYQIFSVDYLQNILGSNPQPDSVMYNVRLFRAAYQNVFTESEKTFKDFSSVEKEIKQGFQFVQYYFPAYQLPTQLVTYIGPWDAMFLLSNNSSGSGIMRDGKIMGIGLQLAMGSDFPVYKDGGIQEMYPAFVSRRFDKKYIAADAIKVIIDDIYPSRTNGKPLVEQMIEAGKRLYVLDALLPYTADSIKTGYTKNQLEGCFKNEANIWSFFVTNDLLFTTEPSIVKDYMSDGPNTAALGNESPGFIGQFVGWQIVKKWMDKNDKKTIQDLLKTPAKEIFEKSKYKP